jgi:hypothetical protein
MPRIGTIGMSNFKNRVSNDVGAYWQNVEETLNLNSGLTFSQPKAYKWYGAGTPFLLGEMMQMRKHHDSETKGFGIYL